MCSLLLLSLMAAPPVDEFESLLLSLKQQRVQDVGRDALVAKYEKFITDYAKHPKVARAMLDLSSIYRLVDPAIKLQSDPEKSNEWLDRAARSAPKGSALWLEAHQGLVGRYTYCDPKQAAKINDEIAKTFAKDSLALARVEKARMTIAFVSGHVDDAMAHAETLFNWYSDPVRIPSDGWVKWELDSLMVGAGSELSESLRYSRITTEEKKEKLRYFTTHCCWIPGLSAMAGKALDSVDGPLFGICPRK